jgi:TRAP-type C4-dicarboxylate transport system permease large subunit
VFKGVLPFLVAVIAGIALLLCFPQIVTLLPSLMY